MYAYNNSPLVSFRNGSPSPDYSIWDDRTAKLMEVKDFLADTNFYREVRNLLFCLDDDIPNSEPWEDDSFNAYLCSFASYGRTFATGHTLRFNHAMYEGDDLIRIEDTTGSFSLEFGYRQTDLPEDLDTGMPRLDHKFWLRAFEGDVSEFRRFVVWSTVSQGWTDDETY
jgi:hypothetical protein